MRDSTICATLSVIALTLPTPAAAQLGNVTYQPSELGKPLVSFDEARFGGGPGGSNTVLMLRKHMIVMASHDSGVKDGPLHVFDVKDPRAPKLLKRYTSAATANLRELHAMPVAVVGGRDYLVAPSVSGVQFFDFTDPLAPTEAGHLALQGVNGGDYDNAAWMTSWAWPYVYVSGTGNGVYVVDARNPQEPKLVTRIQSGELGGFRVGPVYAAGNYLVVTGMDGTPTKVSVLDVGDPSRPALLATGQAPAPMYSAVVIGDRIYGSGEGGQYSFMKWSDTSVDVIGGSVKLGSDKGGYCTFQDTFIFCGQSSEGFRKIDVSDEQNIRQVGAWNLEANGADTDFATVLGNLVYLGNDHGSGAAFIPHQIAPDTTPPKLLAGYPANGALQQPLSTRITLFFSDEIDLDSVSSDKLRVRPVGGEQLAGSISRSSFNAISFGAETALEDDTTYEVVIEQGGLTDLANNAIAERAVLRFSTGSTIDALPTGAGGQGGSGGGGGSSGYAGSQAGPAGASGGNPGGSSVGGTSVGGSAMLAGAGRPSAPSAETQAGCGFSGSSTHGATTWAALTALLLVAYGRRRS